MHSNGIKFLLALKNASVLKKELVFFYYNNLSLKLAEVLYRTGLIQNFCIEKNKNLILATNSGLFSCGSIGLKICKHVV